MKTLKDMLEGILGGKSEAPETSELQTKVEKWVTKTWDEIRNAYLVYHQNAWRARLYYAGEFYLELDRSTKYWTRLQPSDDWVPQPKLNRFSPAIDAINSNFSSVPEIEAIPVPKDDEQAMAVANIVNQLAQHAIKDNALRSDYKSREDRAGYAAMEFVLSGCVFTLVYPRDEVIGRRPKMTAKPAFAYQCVACDRYESGIPMAVEQCPQCGQPVTPEQTESVEPEIGDDGRPAMEDVTRRKVVVELADPLEIFPRPGAKNMAETPYILHASRMTLDDIWYRWHFEASADNDYPDTFNLQNEFSLNYYYVGFSQNSSQSKDACLVIQTYCEPGRMKDFPEGFYAVLINKKCVYFRLWEEEFVEHPVTMGLYGQLPRIFFPRLVSLDLCEIQYEKGSYESLIKLHGMTSAVEPVVIDENTIVSEITGRADKVVKWRSIGPGSKEPHRMKHGVLDEGIYRQRDKLDEEFQNISRAVSVFRGEQPGSVTAASAIQTLRGQAELQYAKPVANWANLWKETVRKVVKNYQRYSLDQLVEILGQEHVEEIQVFQQANLDDCLEFMATTTGLPRTRDEKRQELMTMFDKGALDTNDPKVKEKIFELFGETGAMSTFNDDARRARRAVKLIRSGQLAVFRPGIDDPSVHLGIGLEAAKSLDFDRWDPAAQQGLIDYIGSIRQSQAPVVPPPGEGIPTNGELPAREAKPAVQANVAGL